MCSGVSMCVGMNQKETHNSLRPHIVLPVWENHLNCVQVEQCLRERPSPRVIYSKRSKNTTEISPQISICGMIAAIICLSTGKWRSSGNSALLGGGQGAEFSLLSCNWSQKKTSPSHAMKHLIENLQGENPQYS